MNVFLISQQSRTAGFIELGAVNINGDLLSAECYQCRVFQTASHIKRLAPRERFSIHRRLPASSRIVSWPCRHYLFVSVVGVLFRPSYVDFHAAFQALALRGLMFQADFRNCRVARHRAELGARFVRRLILAAAADATMGRYGRRTSIAVQPVPLPFPRLVP